VQEENFYADTDQINI
jgi:hypothetical protein